MKTKRSREGYLLIDHSNGPGTLLVPGGKKGEWPTIRCCHCHRTYAVNPLRERARGWCSRCDDYVCDDPKCHRDCLPLQKVFDIEQEAAARGLPVTPGGIILP